MRSRIDKRHIGNAMGNQINLLARNSEYILQESRRVLAHDNKTIRARGDFLHHDKLIDVGLTKNRMKSRHHGHFQVLQQAQDMAAGLSSENPVLVLQADDVNVAGIQKVGRSFVG